MSSKSFVLFILLSMLPAAAWAAAAARVCAPEHYGGHPGNVDTVAIQHAIDACNRYGGGTVRLSSGVWISGPLELKSNVTLELEEGAMLLAKKSRAGFLPAFIDTPARAGEALILASHARNVRIIGQGEIVGGGSRWWKQAYALNDEAFRKKYPGIPTTNGMPRPWLVEFNDVSHGLIKGVHLLDSPMWTLVIRNSHDVDVDGIVINNPAHSPNTDGIDIVSSHGISVTGSRITAGDDNIAIKSGLKSGLMQASRNIHIANCTFLNGGGIAIGSETANGIGRISVSHVRFYGTDNGIHVKSARDRGARIGPLLVEHVAMRDVTMPIVISDSYGQHSKWTPGDKPSALTRKEVTSSTPYIHGIHIRDLSATGAQVAMIISGLPEAPVRDLILKNVNIKAKFGVFTRYVDGTFEHVDVTTSHGKAMVQGPDTELRIGQASAAR